VVNSNFTKEDFLKHLPKDKKKIMRGHHSQPRKYMCTQNIIRQHTATGFVFVCLGVRVLSVREGE
jgi:6-phosphogluconolactonase/glucosamine-6-phosphate isomerase/deaminase